MRTYARWLFGTAAVFNLLVAGDPVTFRPYIHLGAVGKLLAVACTVWPWWIGAVPWTMLAPVGPDLIYALLFLDFLRRTKAAR